MTARASEQLAAARVEIEHVCRLLVSPSPAQLDRCAERLAAAIGLMKAGRESGAAAHAPEFVNEDLLQLRALEESLRRARRLLEAAAAFHNNWRQCLGILCGGYTDRGAPAALDAGCRLWARG